MTDKEKLEKIKALADKMYSRMAFLTSDTRPIRQAMDEYHQFIINEYHKEEPVSEDLDEAGKEWLRPQLDKSYANYGEAKMMELTHFDGYSMLEAIEFGAQWQRDQILNCNATLLRTFELGKIEMKHQILKAMDLGEPPYLISVEKAYYDVKKLLEG